MPAIPNVVHQAPAERFEALIDSATGTHTAWCTYHRDGKLMVLQHTEVPAALQGQGVGGVLVAAALGWARAQGLRVRPSCSYAAAYMQRHPETQDLLETAAGAA